MLVKHYTNTAEVPMPRDILVREQPTGDLEHDRDIQVGCGKPLGLWVTPSDAEWGWKEWCEAEDYCLDGIKFVHSYILNMDGVLLISDTEMFDVFTEEYAVDGLAGIPTRTFGHGRKDYVDWQRVAQRWPRGIMITPYLSSRRLGGGLWYYGWDCASGCIWSSRALTYVGTHPVTLEEDPTELDWMDQPRKRLVVLEDDNAQG